MSNNAELFLADQEIKDAIAGKAGSRQQLLRFAGSLEQ
jgi:hypothetical protein